MPASRVQGGRKETTMKRLISSVKTIDLLILWLARSVGANWFRTLVMLFLVCVVATIYFSRVEAAFAEIIHEAKHTVLPTGFGNDRNLMSQSVNFFFNYCWSYVMPPHSLCWLIPSLIIAGIFLHAFLVYFEIKERLQKRQQWGRRPILWKTLAMMGALLIAIPAFNEFCPSVVT